MQKRKTEREKEDGGGENKKNKKAREGGSHTVGDRGL
jgi:hypothetical protein